MFCNIRTKIEKNSLPADAILTPTEALQTVKACKNQRDRAFVFTLWDSAARLDEVLSLKIKDAIFDKYGAVLTVKGKTGMRRIRIVDSVPDLQLWVNQYHGDPDDYLFPNQMGKMSHRGAQNLITRAAERAGLKDRHVHPHLYRHSRLTDLTKKGLGEMELRLFAGWELSSNSPATYIHLSGKDIEDKILTLHGIIQADKKEEAKATIKICPRCQVSNPFDSLFCCACSMILDSVIAQKTENEEKAEKQALEDRLKRLFERQLKSDILNVEIALRSGAITTEDAELQKEILQIGFRMDTGELSDTEGNKQIEKLLNS
jgi:hypothetical protein